MCRRWLLRPALAGMRMQGQHITLHYQVTEKPSLNGLPLSSERSEALQAHATSFLTRTNRLSISTKVSQCLRASSISDRQSTCDSLTDCASLQIDCRAIKPRPSPGHHLRSDIPDEGDGGATWAAEISCMLATRSVWLQAANKVDFTCEADKMAANDTVGVEIVRRRREQTTTRHVGLTRQGSQHLPMTPFMAVPSQKSVGLDRRMTMLMSRSRGRLFCPAASGYTQDTCLLMGLSRLRRSNETTIC